MRWSSNLAERFSVTLVALLAIAAALLLSASPDETRLSVYSTVANYSLSVHQPNNAQYVGLLELLEPLGTVTARTVGDHWRFRYNDAECEFTAGKPRARVRGSDMDLPASFLLENGRGLVSLSSLSSLLPRILGGPVTFNEGARRLFVGNVAVHFTAQIAKAPAPKLVMNFSSPVNPTIATEPGRLRMVFTHDPVVAPGSPRLTFDSNVIPSASFEESNGTAEIVITSSGPVMASFSNDGRTITIAPPTSPAQTQAAPPSETASATQSQASRTPSAPPTLIASTSAPAASNQRVFAVVDAAHGGVERGAALTDQLAEKDVTLAIARALRSELMARGMSAMLLRDGDLGLPLDQRAATANSSGAAIYICVHATSEGNGLHLYTAFMSNGGESRGPFLDWESAQSRHQMASQMAEAGVANELRIKQLPVRTSSAPLRPLNNITTAALAIEVSPMTGNTSQLTSPEFQQSIAAAVAAGLSDVRDTLLAGQK